MVVTGGKSDPEWRYIDPTVIYPVTWSDRIMADEIFGPILAVMVYDDIDKAILEVKQHPKPLSASQAISEVVAPTRRPLAPQNKLVNPVNLRLDELAPRVKSWNVDAVICALGTTKAKAGSQEDFRYVDYTIPLVFAKAAHTAGVETFALVSAIGASASSMFFYAKTKGEVERDIQKVGFRSLTICRPSIIAGERSEMRIAEGTVLAMSRVLAPILPRKFHINPASVIAASLLDSVLTAKAGCRWIFAEELN